jgi:amino acid adenylation domain-containing protein
MAQKTSFHETEASEYVLAEPLKQWAGTPSDYPAHKTVAQLFHEVCVSQPDATAVEAGPLRIGYGQLNARADQLAARLTRRGVGPEILVGVCLDRSIDLIVALLAVLKAGGAYVPFDPAYPRERLDFMLADTKTPVMLTQKSLASMAVGTSGISTILLDEEMASDAEPEISLSQGSPSNLAYVIYTSGSTGRPKGVLVENRSIVRLVKNTNYCHFGSEEVFLQSSPVPFDASTFEIWGALLNGAKLVLMPSHAFSLDQLGQTIRDHGVTTLFLTTALFNLMVEERVEFLRPLRQLLMGGENHSVRHMQKFLKELPECTLIHCYGPTEVTTYTTAHPLRASETFPNPVPIGRPIANTTVYILNHQLQPVPPGETGELCAGGVGVARGYLNCPELTAQKFVPDPFSADAGARLYRTGDLARWLPDGTIEFVGRIDNQVKILGHRIEPGEIEATLAGHEGISQVCVIVHTEQNGTKRLVAYYAPRTPSAVSPGEVKNFLEAKLPDYMVPSFLVPVKEFRLNANGKIDRAFLPAPVALHATENGAAARAPFEQAISDEWKHVAGIDHVGLDDNFFDLGGDSLQLIAIHARLQQQLQKQFDLTALFEFATVRSLAKHLADNSDTTAAFAAVQTQAAKQRDAFLRMRNVRGAKP